MSSFDDASIDLGLEGFVAVTASELATLPLRGSSEECRALLVGVGVVLVVCRVRRRSVLCVGGVCVSRDMVMPLSWLETSIERLS